MKTKTIIRMITMMLVSFLLCTTLPVFALVYSPGPTTYGLDRSRLIEVQKASLDGNTIVLEANGSIKFDLLLPFDADSLTVSYKTSGYLKPKLTVKTDKNSYSSTLNLSSAGTSTTLNIRETIGSNTITFSSTSDVQITDVIFNKVNENYNEYNNSELKLTTYEDAVLTSVIVKNDAFVLKTREALQRWSFDNVLLTPLNMEGSLYVPFKKFAEALGFYSEEYIDKAFIYMQDEKQSMSLIGGRGYIESDKDGRRDFSLDVYYDEGITWVPLRKLAEALGFTVCYKDGFAVIDDRLTAENVIKNEEIFRELTQEFSKYISTEEVKGNTYHVSQDSTVANPDGTKEAPYKTIAQASAVAKAGDTVIIHKGIYRETLKPQSDGTAKAPITFMAAEGENVIISALEQISGFITHKNKILKVNVTEDLGFGRNQLFYKGEALNQGRHPNEDTKPGVVPYPDDVPKGLYATRGNMRIRNEGGDRVYSSTDLNQDDNFWKGGSYITLKGEGWSLAGGEIVSSTYGSLRVKDYDETKAYNLGLTLPPTYTYKYYTHVFESDYGYITNHLNTVDIPGEWFMNENVLYVIPPEGANVDSDFEIKQRQLCIDLREREYITIKGIDTIGGGITMSGDKTTGCILDGGEFKYIAHHTVLYDQEQYSLYPDEHIHSLRSIKAGEAGICLGGQFNAVVNSTIDYSSATGITLLGKYHYINNNKISNTSYSGGYPGGIWVNADTSKSTLEGVLFGGHFITENTVFNSGRSVILLESSKNGKSYAVLPLEIAYNRFYNGALTSRDTGVTYEFGFTGGNDKSKTRMHHNFVYNAGYKDKDTEDLLFLLYQDGYVAARDTYCNVTFYTEDDKAPQKQVFEQAAEFTVLRCRNNTELGYINDENDIKMSDYHGGRIFNPGCDHDDYSRSLDNFNNLRNGIHPYYPTQQTSSKYVFENVKINSGVKTALNLYLNRPANAATSVEVNVNIYDSNANLKKTVNASISADTKKFYVYELHKGLIVIPEMEEGTYKLEIEFADGYSDLSRMIVNEFDSKYDNLYTKSMEDAGIIPYYPSSVAEITSNQTKIVTFKDVQIESGTNTALNLHVLRDSGRKTNVEITAEIFDSTGKLIERRMLANNLQHTLNNAYEALNGMVVVPPLTESGKYTVKLILSDTYSEPLRLLTQNVGSEYDPLFNSEIILGGSYDSWIYNDTRKTALSKTANLTTERIAGNNHYAATNCWNHTIIYEDRLVKENASVMCITYGTGDLYVGSTINVYADSLDSEPIASLVLDDDVKWKPTSEYVTLTRELEAGLHTFYFKFVNGSENKWYTSNLHNFSFGNSIPVATEKTMFFANFEDMSVESDITADQVYTKTGVPMKFTKVSSSTTDAFASFVAESDGNKMLRLTTTKESEQVDSVYTFDKALSGKVIEAGVEFSPAETGVGAWHFFRFCNENNERFDIFKWQNGWSKSHADVVGEFVATPQVNSKYRYNLHFVLIPKTTGNGYDVKIYDTSGQNPILFYQAEVPEEFGDIYSIEPVRFYSGVGGWPARIDNYFVKVYDMN